jgi:hypothetical protein
MTAARLRSLPKLVTTDGVAVEAAMRVMRLYLEHPCRRRRIRHDRHDILMREDAQRLKTSSSREGIARGLDILARVAPSGHKVLGTHLAILHYSERRSQASEGSARTRT